MIKQNKNFQQFQINTNIILIILLSLIYRMETFVAATSLFHASTLGTEIVTHDAILVNNSQTLFVSFNRNGVQYLNKYSIQSGQLTLQVQLSVRDFNYNADQVTLLYAYSNQTKLIAFCGNTYKIYILSLITFSATSTSTSVYKANSNFSQLVWSPVNNNIYFVDSRKQFGYLNFSQGIIDPALTSGGGTTTMTNKVLYSFSSQLTPILHMSVSINYTYIAVSSTTSQLFVVFNIKTNLFVSSLFINGVDTTAHDWLTDQFLYIMTYSSGVLYSYNVTQNNLTSFSCFPAQSKFVHSLHIYKLSDGTIEYIIGHIQNMSSSAIPARRVLATIPALSNYVFSQFDITTLTIVKNYDVFMTESLIRLKYDINNPENAILIFSTYLDSVRIIEQCTTGYVYDSSIFNCTIIITVDSSNSSLTDQQISILNSIIRFILQNQFIMSLNKVPGNRKLLKPFFMFFLNFDDLQLYIYHERNYDYAFTLFLQTIQNLENQKWSLIGFQTIWNQIGVNTTEVKQNFDSKYMYTSWKFLSVQSNSSGFMINTLNLFLSNMFLIFFIYLIFRILFFALFQYTISKILRQFSFWPYLYFMLIDGNLQFLTYMFGCEVKLFFSFNFSNKLGMVFMILIFFVVFILINCSYFILRQVYGVLAKYFFDDTKVSVQAAIYLTLQFGYRNLLLGLVHALFNQNYMLKLSLLLTIQVVFLMNSVLFFKRKGFFSNQTRILINIVAALLRILLIFTFFFNQQNPTSASNMTTLQVVMQQIHFIIVIVYVSLGFFSILFQVSKIMYEAGQFLIKRHHQSKQLEQKQEQQLKSIKKVMFNQNEEGNGIIFLVSSQNNSINQPCILNECSIKVKNKIQSKTRRLKNVKKNHLKIKIDRQIDSVLSSLHETQKNQ